MREQLIQYVQLLFAGAADCDDTRQEILQNTLDRYDDLIAAGKTPEAAYRLAIMGIGDINEILGRTSGTPAVMPVPAVSQEKQDTPTKKILRAIGVGLYILCPLPLFSDGGTDGLCGTLIFIAIATALVILGAKKEGSESKSGTAENTTPETELKKKRQRSDLGGRPCDLFHCQLPHGRMVHHLGDLPHHRRRAGAGQSHS